MTINVLIEIPKGSRNKYELDKESGRIKLDRVLHSSVAYPADYGFIPGTQSDDGDALDVVLITRFPTFPGCELQARPIGMIEMVDTGENDEKIVAVPEKDPYFSSWKDMNDIPEGMRNEINEFFATYKNLEPGKHVEIKGWKGAKEAEEIIKKSQIKPE
ncbi:MAG: inorganic diphosphatase [Candidatus Colwellbacteria bacterium]|nr:inorganic diphosphatase [Candidatus Colwellbacteria bacterium]